MDFIIIAHVNSISSTKPKSGVAKLPRIKLRLAIHPTQQRLDAPIFT
jgi:hypothetical protein